MEWDAHGAPTHYKLVPDVGPYVERGFPQAATFAPNPYEARRRMIRLYAEGHSPRRIREMLLASGVPTATMMTPRAGSPGEWYPQTVRMLVNNPLNEGKLYNFRHRNVTKDPDDRHEDEWTQQAPVPLDKQIEVTPKYGAPEPLMDATTANLLALDGRTAGVEPTVGGVALRGVCVAGDWTWPLRLRWEPPCQPYRSPWAHLPVLPLHKGTVVYRTTLRPLEHAGGPRRHGRMADVDGGARHAGQDQQRQLP